MAAHNGPADRFCGHEAKMTRQGVLSARHIATHLTHAMYEKTAAFKQHWLLPVRHSSTFWSREEASVSTGGRGPWQGTGLLTSRVWTLVGPVTWLLTAEAHKPARARSTTDSLRAAAAVAAATAAPTRSRRAAATPSSGAAA
eukprot:303151-Chlamydomonas_euryale.AAC.6